MHKKRIIHLTVGNYKYSSRIYKMCLTQADMGFDVLVLAKWRDGLNKEESVSDSIKIRRIPLHLSFPPINGLSKLLKLCEFVVKVLLICKSYRREIMVCHSIAPLPIGLLCRFLFGMKLVYDAHELETETIHLTGAKKTFYKWLEKRAVRYVDKISTVGDHIADWYASTYKINRPTVIRNVPYPYVNDQEVPGFKKAFGIDDDCILFVNQGKLTAKRNIPQLLRVFSTLPEKYHIVFMGFGSEEMNIREASARCKNIHFKSAVPPNMVLAWTRSADIGIHVGLNECLNYKYANSNKVYEFLSAGLPIIINKDKPEMANLIEVYDCGIGVTNDDNDIRSAILSITEADVLQWGQGAIKAGEELNWSREEGRLRKMYNDFLQ